MQERVLGAIIIGGVATVGIAWAAIEGGINAGRSSKDEKLFEQNLYSLVQNYDSSVTSLDTRVSTYYTRTFKVKTWIPAYGPKDDPEAYEDVDKVFAFVRVHGYTNDNKVFHLSMQLSDSGLVHSFESSKFEIVEYGTEETYYASDKFLADMETSYSGKYSASACTMMNDIVTNETTMICDYSVDGQKVVYTNFDEDGTAHTFVNGVEQNNN